MFSLLFICTAELAHTIEVTPAWPVLDGDPLSITVSGLPAGAPMTVGAERVQSENGQPSKLVQMINTLPSVVTEAVHGFPRAVFSTTPAHAGVER